MLMEYYSDEYRDIYMHDLLKHFYCGVRYIAMRVLVALNQAALNQNQAASRHRSTFVFKFKVVIF